MKCATGTNTSEYRCKEIPGCITTLTYFHEWPGQNFSPQYQYRSSRQVMRIKKHINYEIVSRSITNSSNLDIKKCMADSQENYWWDIGSEGSSAAPFETLRKLGPQNHHPLSCQVTFKGFWSLMIWEISSADNIISNTNYLLDDKSFM